MSATESPQAIVLAFPRILRRMTAEERRRAELVLTRQQLEADIENLIAALDLLDGDPDAEPDHDGEAEPDECSIVPLHLFTDRVPTRRLRAFKVPPPGSYEGDPDDYVPPPPPPPPPPPAPKGSAGA
ncbi:hypothetical protein M0638_20500 [Roseomonas sp. NAR14]|uniref:Uncharacterized protein n=1 Tax=Roseomonas acroporae TaxID=2937791 RepID=A0A9X1YAX3_9PROT|nr:hypothetical protein [Roseomonas acroporae]MCK8786756.1 hypothetical protein [Roseomonas acroporae]